MTFDRMLAMLDSIDGDGNVMSETRNLSCNKVAKGNGFCDKCHEGKYDECRFVKARRVESYLQHDIDLANARIGELQSVNLALIAERDKFSMASAWVERDRIHAENIAMRAEIAELEVVILAAKNQEPVIFLHEQTVKDSIRGVRFGSTSSSPRYDLEDGHTVPLYAEPKPPSVQEGYAIVPIEPTKDMYLAACKAYTSWVDLCDEQRRENDALPEFEPIKWIQQTFSHNDAYKAMIAAAPKQGDQK